MEGSVNPEEVRQEVKRLEEARLRLASEVMGGDPATVEEDRRLEKRIRELASIEREVRADRLKESWRRNHPSEEEEKRPKRGRPA
jgi:hypothetical protein